MVDTLRSQLLRIMDLHMQQFPEHWREHILQSLHNASDLTIPIQEAMINKDVFHSKNEKRMWGPTKTLMMKFGNAELREHIEIQDYLSHWMVSFCEDAQSCVGNLTTYGHLDTFSRALGHFCSFVEKPLGFTLFSYTKTTKMVARFIALCIQALPASKQAFSWWIENSQAVITQYGKDKYAIVHGALTQPAQRFA